MVVKMVVVVVVVIMVIIIMVVLIKIIIDGRWNNFEQKSETKRYNRFVASELA